VVGIDVEAVVVTVLKDGDAATELASATPTVRTNIVDLMVVEANAVLANKKPSAKEALTSILNNATSIATLK
jgi:ABC-type sugar transport system ATPase subunit